MGVTAASFKVEGTQPEDREEFTVLVKSGQSVERQALTRVEGNVSKALVDDFILATTEERSDGEISVNDEKV